MNHISVNLNIDGCTVLAVQTAGDATPRGERLSRAFDAFKAAIEAITEPDSGSQAAQQRKDEPCASTTG